MLIKNKISSTFALEPSLLGQMQALSSDVPTRVTMSILYKWRTGEKIAGAIPRTDLYIKAHFKILNVL